MNLEIPKEEQLPKIYNFIKDQCPHYKSSLKRFLETDSVTEVLYNGVSRVIFDNDRVIAYLSLKDHSMAPSVMRVLKFWISDVERRDAIAKAFFDFAYSNYQQEMISCAVFEDESWKLETLRKFGHIEHSQMWRSSMNPQKYVELDNTSFTDKDVEILSAAEFYKRDKKALEKFYQLEMSIVGIIPADFPMEEMSFEDFKQHKEKSGFNLELSFFALYDNSLIGLSSAMIFNDHAQVMLTGVLKSHQGRGIAFELKQRSILACKKMGFTYLSTMNDSINAPMLSLNSKFGFQKEIAIIRMDRSKKIE